MTTYNTGNPIGSSSAKDLFDNAENLDEAINSSADTFQDRLGKSRLTWAGIVKAGSGDPSIAVDAAARAESAASSVEQNAEQIAQDAAQQAASEVIAGVDGQVAVAQSAANRAETARDAAIINSTMYPDEATGRAAVADGEYFKVIGSGSIAAREFKRVSASVSEFVTEYPSAAAVKVLTQAYGPEVFSTNGAIRTSDGARLNNVDHLVTDYLTIVGGGSYRILTHNTSDVIGFAFYDENKVYIPGSSGSVTGYPNALNRVAPLNAKYFRACTVEATLNDSIGISSTDGRYNLDNLRSSIGALNMSWRSEDVLYESGSVYDALSDPMHTVTTVKTVEERNSLSNIGDDNRAWPPGRRVYDEGLRSEVVADGMFWRLPDGTPADVAERTFVFPDFDDARRNFPTYAAAHSTIADVADIQRWEQVGGSLFHRNDSKGFPAIKVVSPSESRPGIQYLASTNMTVHRYLIFNIFVENPQAGNIFRVFLVSSSGANLFGGAFYNYADGAVPPQNPTDSPYLQQIEFDVEKLQSLKEGASLSDVAGIKITVDRVEGETPVFYLGSVESVSFKPCITLRFDDARASIYPNAYLKMRQYGFPGITAVHTDIVGNSGYCTREQLLEMQQDGWDLVSHFTHQPAGGMNSLSYDDLVAGFRDSKQWLKEAGAGLVARSCYIAPNSLVNELNSNVAYKYYGCTVVGTHLNSSMPRQPRGSYRRGSSWVGLGAAVGDGKNTNQLIAFAEAAINAQRWQLIMMHDILPSYDNNYVVLTDDFHDFVDWLHDHRAEIDVVSLTQMVNRMSGKG